MTYIHKRKNKNKKMWFEFTANIFPCFSSHLILILYMAIIVVDKFGAILKYSKSYTHPRLLQYIRFSFWFQVNSDAIGHING